MKKSISLNVPACHVKGTEQNKQKTKQEAGTEMFQSTLFYWVFFSLCIPNLYNNKRLCIIAYCYVSYYNISKYGLMKWLFQAWSKCKCLTQDRKRWKGRRLNYLSWIFIKKISLHVSFLLALLFVLNTKPIIEGSCCVSNNQDGMSSKAPWSPMTSFHHPTFQTLDGEEEGKRIWHLSRAERSYRNFNKFRCSFILGRSERRPEEWKSKSLPGKKFNLYLGPGLQRIDSSQGLPWSERLFFRHHCALSPASCSPSPFPLTAPCSPMSCPIEVFSHSSPSMVLWVTDRKCTLFFSMVMQHL